MSNNPTPPDHLRTAGTHANMNIRASIARIIDASTSPVFLMTPPIGDYADAALSCLQNALEDTLNAVQLARGIHLARVALAQQSRDLANHDGVEVAGPSEVGT